MDIPTVRWAESALIEVGEGRYRVWLRKYPLDEGIIYILGGGEKSHVGSVVISFPDRPTLTLTLEGHKDELVLVPLAEKAARKYGCPVTAAGGIHIDCAKPEEIETLIKNCESLHAYL